MPFINDKQWSRIEELLPPARRKGRPRADDRQVLEAMLFVLERQCRWSDLPREMGSYATAWRRWKKWQEDGTLDIIRSILPECSAKTQKKA